MTTTPALMLRPIAESDLALLEAWEADPTFDGEFNNWGMSRANHIRRAFAEHGYLADDHARFLVIDAAGAAVGDVSFRRVVHGGGLANRGYEIGITIAPAHRGRGYGAAAQRILADYLFATYPIVRVQATTDIANVAEQRALERAGFTREGVLRQAQWRSGTWHDMVLYSKLRSE